MTQESGTPERPHLSIFDTFKTRPDQLTGEAVRQRAIISMLGAEGGAAEKTRTAIAKAMASKSGMPWKNLYSGIFGDFDQVLMPLGLVREEGRLPLKRGPRALQEQGVPYYGLTDTGVIAALSFEHAGRQALLGRYVQGRQDLGILGALAGAAPRLVLVMLEGHVRRYCRGQGELEPFGPDTVRQTQMDSLSVYGQLLSAHASMSPEDRRRLAEFFGGAKH